MKKFLLIQTASIGDVILATAVAEKLHAFYPDSKIDMMIKKGYESLFEDHPFINKVFVWDKKRHKYRNLYHIWRKIRAQRYDLIVNIQRYAATGFITAFGKARETSGFDKNPFSCLFTHKVKHEIGVRGVHEVDLDADIVKSLLGQGMSELDVAKHLGLDMDTVYRYKQVSGVLELFANVDYSTSWEAE